MNLTQADLNGHKTQRQSSSVTIDALLDHGNEMRDRLGIACDLVRQLLTDGETGLSEDDLAMGWAILSDLSGDDNNKENHV